MSGSRTNTVGASVQKSLPCQTPPAPAVLVKPLPRSGAMMRLGPLASEGIAVILPPPQGCGFIGVQGCDAVFGDSRPPRSKKVTRWVLSVQSVERSRFEVTRKSNAVRRSTLAVTVARRPVSPSVGSAQTCNRSGCKPAKHPPRFASVPSAFEAVWS